MSFLSLFVPSQPIRPEWRNAPHPGSIAWLQPEWLASNQTWPIGKVWQKYHCRFCFRGMSLMAVFTLTTDKIGRIIRSKINTDPFTHFGELSVWHGISNAYSISNMKIAVTGYDYMHLKKKKRRCEPLCFLSFFQSPKTSLFPLINCCLCQTFLGNRRKRSSFSSKCHTRQLGGNVVGFCFDDHSGVRTCEINHLGKKITQHAPS